MTNKHQAVQDEAIAKLQADVEILETKVREMTGSIHALIELVVGLSDQDEELERLH